LAGPRIDEMLTPEALFDLLEKGGPSAYGEIGLSKPSLFNTPNFRSLFRFLSNMERFGRDFSMLVPLSVDEKTGYRIHLRLEDWTWKLSELGLPEAVQASIAAEIAKSNNK
jgi:hypothetical protein